MTKLAWKLAHLVSVRDKQSEQTARAWGLKAELTADPVWLLQEKPLAEDNPFFRMLKLRKQSQPIIGISLRPSKNFSQEHMELLPEVLSLSLPSNAFFLMLPLQKDSDYRLLRTLCDRLGNLGAQSAVFEEDVDMLPVNG